MSSGNRAIAVRSRPSSWRRYRQVADPGSFGARTHNAHPRSNRLADFRSQGRGGDIGYESQYLAIQDVEVGDFQGGLKAHRSRLMRFTLFSSYMALHELTYFIKSFSIPSIPALIALCIISATEAVSSDFDSKSIVQTTIPNPS